MTDGTRRGMYSMHYNTQIREPDRSNAFNLSCLSCLVLCPSLSYPVCLFLAGVLWRAVSSIDDAAALPSCYPPHGSATDSAKLLLLNRKKLCYYSWAFVSYATKVTQRLCGHSLNATSACTYLTPNRLLQAWGLCLRTTSADPRIQQEAGVGVSVETTTAPPSAGRWGAPAGGEVVWPPLRP